MKKKIICLLILLSCFSFLFAIFSSSKIYAEVVRGQSGTVIYYPGTSKAIEMPAYEKQEVEFRGVWVSFFAGDISGYQSDVQMKKQLLEVLDTMEEFNLNAIMFHMRTHNDALYPTDLAPVSSYTKGMDYERFDYIEWFINECHKRGIEFHAWLNPYRISNSTSLESILTKYADYQVNPASKQENILINKSGAAILDPGRPVVQDYIVDVCMEIARKYDIDAIHFDDYFYISDVDDSETRKLYNTNKLSVAEFRRQSVDAFIKKLSDSLYEYNIENHKCIQLGISPSGIYQNASSYVSPTNYKYNDKGDMISPSGSVGGGYSHYDSPLYCNTKKWIDNEWIDYITPQVYNGFDNTAACYAAIVEWWNGVVKYKKCNLYIGIGLYKMNQNNGEDWSETTTEWINQLRFNQACENVKGTCIYQYRTLVRNKSSEMIQNVLTKCFTHKTVLPVARRYADLFSEEDSIDNVTIYKKDDALALKWDSFECKNYYIYNYVNSSSLTEPTSIIGMNGNFGLEMCVANLKNNDYSKLAIVPLNLANEKCKVKIIDISDATDFETDNVVQYDGYFLTGMLTQGAKMTLRFYEARILYGSSVSYEVYYCNGLEWKENEKKKLEVGKLSDLNYASFSLDKHGCPIVLRIKAITEFGSQYSEDIVVAIVYNDTNELFGEVFTYIDEFINNLYN